jgi:hypothetical protein
MKVAKERKKERMKTRNKKDRKKETKKDRRKEGNISYKLGQFGILHSSVRIFHSSEASRPPFFEQ